MFENEFITENIEETRNNIDLSSGKFRNWIQSELEKGLESAKREVWFDAEDVEKELREL